MDDNKAGASLDLLMSSFTARIAELQELVIARNASPASISSDLSAVDLNVTAMEQQLQGIKDRLREEKQAIPKAKKLIDAALRQQKKLQSMSAYVPHMPVGNMATENLGTIGRCWVPEVTREDLNIVSSKTEESAAKPKEKKGRSPPPAWYISADELESLSAYMRGRLTLEKINAAISDIVSYAETNFQLISNPKKKVAENVWEKALELRDIATTEGVKGKHFFLESDMKGPSLRLDNTGKAILTVLRHLGRISETRVGPHRVMILLKPQ